MGATELIFKLRNDGYSIKADGGYLDISPADDLSPEFVKQLKQGKPEILCALRQEEELKRLDKKRESRAIATAIPAIPSIKIAGVNLQTDHTPEPTKAEKLQAPRSKEHELDSLIEYVAAGNNFSAEDIIEAKHYATKDVENALTSFRALARDIRRDRVMEMLIASPGSMRAVYTDTFSDPNNVILAIAVRNGAVAEMLIPRSQYDPFKLMSALDGEVH